MIKNRGKKILSSPAPKEKNKIKKKLVSSHCDIYHIKICDAEHLRCLEVGTICESERWVVSSYQPFHFIWVNPIPNEYPIHEATAP